MFDQLEKKEHVRRYICQEDNRVTYFEITESGKALMDEIFPLHAKKIETCFGKLKEDELVQLKELLKKVR